MRQGILLAMCLLVSQPALYAGQDQARQPQKGGSRVMTLFPADVTLPAPQGLEHSQALPNVTKDPRSPTADNVLDGHLPE